MLKKLADAYANYDIKVDSIKEIRSEKIVDGVEILVVDYVSKATIQVFSPPVDPTKPGTLLKLVQATGIGSSMVDAENQAVDNAIKRIVVE